MCFYCPSQPSPPGSQLYHEHRFVAPVSHVVIDRGCSHGRSQWQPAVSTSSSFPLVCPVVAHLPTPLLMGTSTQ
eukprot:682629-Rhodomonas_salina.1